MPQQVVVLSRQVKRPRLRSFDRWLLATLAGRFRDLAIGVAGWQGGAAAVVTSALMAAVCRRRLGGITGDTMGATTELTEVAILLVAVALR